MFKINKNFMISSFHISNMQLCTVRLYNNSKFPWILLIPKRKNITDITDLNSKDQLLLIKEIVYSSKIIKKIFKTSKLNVEKIGNKVPQLHIHIIARKKNDISWPLPVWAVKEKPYTKADLDKIIRKIKKSFK